MNNLVTKSLLICTVTLAIGFMPVRKVKAQVIFDGCSPDYWKDHTAQWPATGFLPDQSVQSVFSKAFTFGLGRQSLLQAVISQSSDGEKSYGRYHRRAVKEAARTLIPAAVAPLLNSAHLGVEFLRTTTEVINEVNTALASRNRDTILALAGELDFLDSAFACPLNNS